MEDEIINKVKSMEVELQVLTRQRDILDAEIDSIKLHINRLNKISKLLEPNAEYKPIKASNNIEQTILDVLIEPMSITKLQLITDIKINTLNAKVSAMYKNGILDKTKEKGEAVKYFKK